MSTITDAIRLLRAVTAAQRELDSWQGRTGRYADRSWCEAHERLQQAETELQAFIEAHEA